VHGVPTTTWGETAITARNAPAVRARVSASSGPTRHKGYVSVDVSSLVTRSGLVSLAVKGRSTSPLGLRSREAGSGRPRLVVETSKAGTAGGGGGGGTGGGGGGTSVTACGTVSGPPRRVDHVIWIWMENKPFDAIVGSASAPFENALASACGLATNYRAVSHPSLPNYIAATSGGTQGIADDEPPSAHPLDVASIYSQVKSAGKTWRDYEESAPANCSLTSSGQYAVKHDPAAYYTSIRSDCAARDVPMGTTTSGNFLNDLTNGTLPAFAFVTPDLCNDTHDCPVSTGDAWLQSWFTKILASPTYATGRTVVFVNWDEDDDSASNHVPLIAVNPSIPAGTRTGTLFDHYALLRTTEQLLGIGTYLGKAADAPSMVSAFNLG
jgi:phospholipase C